MIGSNERGAAVVEFALVVPMLLAILFGIIEFSILFYDKAVITNASREAAREGILYRDPRPTEAELQTVVNNYTQDRLISLSVVAPPDLSFVATPSYDSEGLLEVTVAYDFNFAFLPGFVSDLLPTIPLDAQTTMRIE